MGRHLVLSAWVLLIAAGAWGRDTLVSPTHPSIRWMGRFDDSNPFAPRVSYPGVTVTLRFEGEALTARLASTTDSSRLQVSVDDQVPRIVRLAQGPQDLALATGLSGGPHTVVIAKRTETWQGVVTFLAFELRNGTLLDAPRPPARRLLFVGDSVTCGAGVDRRGCEDKDASETSDATGSFGMELGRRVGAEVHLVCWGGRGIIRDWRGRTDVLTAAQFFELSVPDETTNPPWNHTRYVPDAVVVNLGTNDFNLSIGALPEQGAFVSAYVRLLRRIRALHPGALILLTEGTIVNDGDAQRLPRTTLGRYIAAVVAQAGDDRVIHAPVSVEPGLCGDAHPPRDQSTILASEIEVVLRQRLGW